MIENDKKPLPSLLKPFSMFKIKCFYSLGEDEIKNTGEKISIRCSNCGKETMIDVDNLNTMYQDKSTNFVLDTMLHHYGMI